MPRIAPCVAAFVLALAAPLASAKDAPDPLRLVPAEANIALKVEHPRALVEAITKLDGYEGYLALPQVRETLDAPTTKRFFQLIAHAETKLGAKWPDLLDKLAGGGIALGTVAGADPAPAVVVLQGTDEAAVKDGYKLLLTLIEDELARLSPTDAPAKLKTGTKNGADLARLGDGFFLARLGPAILAATSESAMTKALALAAGEKGAKSVLDIATVPAAKKLLGGDPLAWLWYDLDRYKQTPAAKDFFAATRKDFLQTMVVGSSVDAVRRADFVSAGLFKTDAGLKLSVRLPAKRADLPPELALHAPLKGDAVGSLPLLEPPGVLYSQSFYLDLRTFWTDRAKLLNEQAVKDFEKGAADVSKLLPGTSVGKLLELTGPHHRFVAVERGNNQYKTVPDYPLPEMALVTSLRDAKAGKQFDTALRSAGVFASLGFGMTMSEEKVGDVTVVSYRFTNDGKAVAADSTNIRLNFVPSFAVVNDSLVIATSPQLVKDLIPELRKTVSAKDCSPAVWRNRVYGSGLGAGLRARPDAYVSDAVLSGGVGLGEAKARVEQYAKYLGTLGTAGIEIDHTAEFYRFDVEWKAK